MNTNRSLTMMRALATSARFGAMASMGTDLMKKTFSGPVNDKAAKSYFRYLGKRPFEVMAIKKERARKKKAKKFARATRQQQRRAA